MAVWLRRGERGGLRSQVWRGGAKRAPHPWWRVIPSTHVHVWIHTYFYSTWNGFFYVQQHGMHHSDHGLISHRTESARGIPPHPKEIAGQERNLWRQACVTEGAQICVDIFCVFDCGFDPGGSGCGRNRKVRLRGYVWLIQRWLQVKEPSLQGKMCRTPFLLT